MAPKTPKGAKRTEKEPIEKDAAPKAGEYELHKCQFSANPKFCVSEARSAAFKLGLDFGLQDYQNQKSCLSATGSVKWLIVKAQ